MKTKTLYININGEAIKSDENIEVVGSIEDTIVDSFYISLGMAIADGETGIKYKPLVVEFAKAKPNEFRFFETQWKEVKGQLLGENPSGDYEFTLSSEYLDWLKMNATYSTIYYKKYQNLHQAIIKLNLDELYEDTVDVIRRKVIRYLQTNDNEKKIDEFVVNDDAVTRRSLLVRSIKSKFEISFIQLEKWEEAKAPVIENKEKRVSSTGIEKIELTHKYEGISKFSEGFAVVKRDNKYGFINADGNEIISCVYDDAEPFINGLAKVKHNSWWEIINQKGQIVDNRPNLQRVNEAKIVFQRTFHEGLCAYRDFDKKWGFIDQYGEIVIPCQFIKVSDFNNGFAQVRLPQSRKTEFKYITKDGNIVSEEDAKVFFTNTTSENEQNEQADIPTMIIVITAGEKCGVKDINGQLLIPQLYSQIEYIGEGIICAASFTDNGFMSFPEIDLFKILNICQSNVRIKMLYESQDFSISKSLFRKSAIISS